MGRVGMDGADPDSWNLCGTFATVTADNDVNRMAALDCDEPYQIGDGFYLKGPGQMVIAEIRVRILGYKGTKQRHAYQSHFTACFNLQMWFQS